MGCGTKAARWLVDPGTIIMSTGDLAWQVGDGQRDGGARTALPENELQMMEQRLKAAVGDTDRLRLLKNMLVSHRATKEQATRILQLIEVSASKIEALVAMVEASDDRATYAQALIGQLRFAVRAYLRLQFCSSLHPHSLVWTWTLPPVCRYR